MKKYNKFIKKFTTNAFFIGSLTMVIGTNIHNFGQFLYHFLSGRLLGSESYGDLASIISIYGFLGIVQMSMSLTIVKFIAASKTENETNNFINWIYKISIKISLVMFVVMLLVSGIINDFLHINDSKSILYLAPIIFFFTNANTLRSSLQGLLKFDKFVLSLIGDTIVKITLTLALIYLGYSIHGALAGITLGTVVGFFIARKYLVKRLSLKVIKKPKIKPILLFTLPVFVNGISTTSMYTADLLLVKHFFDAHTAGIYASLAILGRVVFFGTSPITQVMFPIITKRRAEKKHYHIYLYLSIFAVAAFAGFITLIFYFIPNVPLLVLYGKEYIEGAALLWYFGIFMGILAMCTLLGQFYLSIGKTKIISIYLIAAIVQIFLIWNYHETINQVIIMSIITSTGLLASLLIYYPWHEK